MITLRIFRELILVGFVLLGAGSLLGQIRSGLPAGSPTESIPVSDVTGPYKGERVCYVCEFETDPNVLAFFRDTSDETAKLIVELNRLYVKNKARNFKAVAMIIAGSDSRKWLENLNRTEKLEIPLTFFTKGPKDVAARIYQLNPDAQNTFLVTVNRTVTDNVSDIGSGEFGQVIDATEKMLAGNSRE
jgi:hypothetical protein